MPQLFQVLKCYKCSMFQVHQTKNKSSKWECKLCGEKQSIKRHYGLGTGKECRLHVQKLNGIRGEINEQNEIRGNSDEDIEFKDNTEHNILDTANKSKWSNFIDQTLHENVLKSNESMYLGDSEVVLEIPAKKRRKFKTPKVIHPETNYSNIKNESTETIETEHYQNEKLFNIKCRSNSNTCSIVNSNMPFASLPKTMIPEENDFSTPQSEVSSSTKEIEFNKTKMPYELPLKAYLPAKVNKNSKWAQFAECVENDKAESITTKVSLPNASIYKERLTNNLFTLCDENELDDVLDF